MEQIKNSKTGIFKIHSRLPLSLNKKIVAGFSSHYEDSDIKRTHLFNGRYENIYLNENHIPELKAVMEEACRHAQTILGTSEVKAGYWFNCMPPGAITTVHSHDDDDELLSGVYYVTVPENSGDLVIHTDGEAIKIHPEEGLFVFFKPDVVHEVTQNLSQQERLSIGINFGEKRSDDSVL